MSRFYRAAVLLLMGLFVTTMAPDTAFSRDITPREMRTAVRAGICPGNLATISSLSWEEGCGKYYYKVTHEMSRCRRKVNDINEEIKAYNELIYKCRAARRGRKLEDQRLRSQDRVRKQKAERQRQKREEQTRQRQREYEEEQERVRERDSRDKARRAREERLRLEEEARRLAEENRQEGRKARRRADKLEKNRQADRHRLFCGAWSGGARSDCLALPYARILRNCREAYQYQDLGTEGRSCKNVGLWPPR